MKCVIVTIRDWGLSGCYVNGVLKFEGYSVDGKLLSSLGYEVDYREKRLPSEGPGGDNMPDNLEDVLEWPDGPDGDEDYVD